jgi:membrane protein DedA with SNARE-associated domain
MLPPPMPMKLLEIAAGVFEMKPAMFFVAIAVGKFLRFLLWSILIIRYGPTLIHTIRGTMHDHRTLVLGIGGALVVLIIVWVVRKIFDRNKGTKLPIEENGASPSESVPD